MHKYKCASCGHVFSAENFAEKCPECGSRILIHKEGEPKKNRACRCKRGNSSS
ncbi:MAG: hypothetical protein VB076_00410 [Synergistaceae bacterium]|nr:hypothetical protein [Synergistaceae bacterium]